MQASEKRLHDNSLLKYNQYLLFHEIYCYDNFYIDNNYLQITVVNYAVSEHIKYKHNKHK